MSLSTYARVLGVQVRRSVTLAAQYRWEFLTHGAVSLGWSALGVLPLWIAFRARPRLGAFGFEESLVVTGVFTVLKGFLDGAVVPSLTDVVEHIRKGTLDFVLLKPADAQFLVSTAKIEPLRAIDVLAGGALVLGALRALGRSPSLAQLGAAAALLVAATWLLYSIWILVVAIAFWVVRLDNLAYLLGSIFDFARWPRGVFRGVWAVVFTYVLPIALMTSLPAEALLGMLDARPTVLALGLALAFAAASRVAFVRSLARYASASS